MTRLRLFAALVCALFLPACPAGQGRGEPPAPLPTTTAEAPGGPAEEQAPVMVQGIQKGLVPKKLDIRLERRDRRPLPPGTLLRLQSINRGKNPRGNLAALLHEDGRLFQLRRTDSDDWQTPFKGDFPATPVRTLDAAQLAQVRALLTGNNFLAEPPYQADPRVEDGAFVVLTTRLDGKVHEVIFEAYLPEYVRSLIGLL